MRQNRKGSAASFPPLATEIVSLSVGWILIHAYQFVWTKVHPTGLATAGGMRDIASESETIYYSLK